MKKVIKRTVFFILLICMFGFKDQALQNAGDSNVKDKTESGHVGTIVKILKVPSYVYLELEDEGERYWVAAPSMEVRVGERIRTSKGIEMSNHYSKELSRTFERIHFVTYVNILDGKGDGGHKKGNYAPSTKTNKTTISVDKPLKKAKGGYNLEDIFKGKNKLNGKSVSVRGKIVKVSGKIMGKHWYHIQDGTGKNEKYDLILTSDDRAQMGDVVLATGTLILDKDLGSGYKYDVILEESALTVEK